MTDRMTTSEAAKLEKQEIASGKPSKDVSEPNGVPLDDAALQNEGKSGEALAPGTLADYDNDDDDEEEDVPMPTNVPLDDVALKEAGDVEAAMAPGDD